MFALVVAWLCFLSAFSQEKASVLKGKATYYHPRFEGRQTSNGERFRHNKMTCANNKLPLNTVVKITNPKNDKSIIVRVNDRLPKKSKVLFDLTMEAARELEMLYKGKINVFAEILDTALLQDKLPELMDEVRLCNNKGHYIFRKDVEQEIKEERLAAKKNSKETPITLTAENKKYYGDMLKSLKAGTYFEDNKAIPLKIEETHLVAIKSESIDSTLIKTDNKPVIENKETALTEAEIISKDAYIDSVFVQPKAEGYGIQVLSFRSVKKAQTEAARLLEKYNLPVTIQPKDVNGKMHYRVILGQYGNIAEIKTAIKTLSKEFDDCYAMKLSQ